MATETSKDYEIIENELRYCKKVKCTICGKIISGGVGNFKQHFKAHHYDENTQEYNLHYEISESEVKYHKKVKCVKCNKKNDWNWKFQSAF